MMGRSAWLVLLAVGALLAMLTAAAMALSPPHDATNGIICNTCHTEHGASYPTQVAQLCQGCHFDGGPAPGVQTHSSRTTDRGYGSWEVDCWGCHDPHTQRLAYGRYLRQRLRARVKIIATDCTTDFCDELSLDRTVFSDIIDYPGQGQGVDGDAESDDDLCQVCHQQTNNYNPTSAFNAHRNYGPSSQPGGDCTTCHDHASGFAAGRCVDCHSTPRPLGNGRRRQVTGANGDFDRSSHHVTDGSTTEIVNDEDCRLCHDPSDHRSSADPAVVLVDADGGSTFTYDGAGGSIEGFCLGCHDADGGPPFPSDGQMAPDIGTGWAGASHDAALTAQACLSCHGGSDPSRAGLAYDQNTHGSDSPSLLSARVAGVSVANSEEALCFACHDGSVASTDIEAEFALGSAPTGVTDPIFRHPVLDSEQVTGPGRTVECADCHDAHQATSANPLFGVPGVDADGNPVVAGTDIAQHEVCFACHADTFNAARPRTSNLRLTLATSNSSTHPVLGPGRNRSTSLQNALLGGLTVDSTIVCTDCHNSEQTADVDGPASGSSASPQGTHGSTNEFLLRGFYWSDPNGPGSWDPANFELCFLCHDVNVWANENNTLTNFDDRGDNFHWLHVNKEAKENITCANCHYDSHGNGTASNTVYEIDGTQYSSPPPGFDTRGVSFSPEITGRMGGNPIWSLDTNTRERNCSVRCHGKRHDERYRPDTGDDDSLTGP